MKDLLIFPYSGTAIEALDCLGDKWRCIGFMSDDPNIIGRKVYGIEVYDRSALAKFASAKVLAVHGSPSSYLKRSEILSSLDISHNRFATVIHPKASIGNYVQLGHNVLIMAGVVLTSNAIVNNHVIILPNSVIHHDSVIGELTLIAANVTIAGNVSVGSNCYIGASSSIKNNVSLGPKILVGMGANVISSYGEKITLIGNPAKPK